MPRTVVTLQHSKGTTFHQDNVRAVTLRGMLKSRFVNVVCCISSILNGLAILGFIVALVRIHNTAIPAWFLAAGLCCIYLILPGWYLAHAFRVNVVPASRVAGIILKVLCAASAVCIVLAAMVVLGVVEAHDSDFPGASILAALFVTAVFAFLPCWYFLNLLFSGKPAR
ncbi:MAG: hypothetical protein M3160_01185 [Candidatus Eremiobacteraeota bacterium]|nr:hypothetical protein [Candidatus Eremiobacteraeota bacterium]